MEKQYKEGISWGEMKNILFEYLNEHLKSYRKDYQQLINDPAEVERELRKGAEKAREISVPFLDQIRSAVGIRTLI